MADVGVGVYTRTATIGLALGARQRTRSTRAYLVGGAGVKAGPAVAGVCVGVDTRTAAVGLSL